MYNNKSDYSSDNNNSRYTSTIEDNGRDIVNYIIIDYNSDFISNSNNNNNFNNYNSNSIDNIVTKDTTNYYISKVNNLGVPI